MALVNAKPLRFSPVGVSDALAEEDAFPGACAALTNLIPHPTTKNLWTPRPASTALTTFGAFSTPTGVPVCKVIGGYVYGLVSTARNSGKDEPFCYNLLTNAFVTVSNITSSNVPTTQSTSGDWTPPTIDIMGTDVVVTHPGFDGVTNFIGWFDISTISAPVWNAGNFKLQDTIVTSAIAFAGSGYTNGSYPATAVVGGTGLGATFDITVAGGAVTVAAIHSGGIGYTIGDVLTVLDAVIGSGSGFAITVLTINGAMVEAVIIDNPGSGYTNGSYSNVALTGGSGTGVQAGVVVGGGTVTTVIITNGGSGYAIGDQLTTGGVILTFGSRVAGSGYTNGTYTGIPLQGGSGLGAFANLTVSGGGVTAATISNGGSGYIAGDTLMALGDSILNYTITNSGDGTAPGDFTGKQASTSGSGYGASFGFSVVNGFVVLATIISGGFNYAPGDTLTFNYGIVLTVSTISTASLLGPGSGFSINAATVSASAIGPGLSFECIVSQVTNQGGFINFTTVPSWVRQFNGRSWFGINPATGIPSVIFSDVYALNATNANQALSFGDNTPLTAAATLGLANLLGGVVQSLIIFKSLNGIIQVTGDQTTNNLSVNQVPGGSGTLAPRSVCEHPQGLLYLDHDGYRMVTLDGNCTDPIGVAGQGVVVPFLNPTNLTRVNAACNGSILRVSVDTAAHGWQEYWFDSTRKLWHGPHTFPSTMIDVYEDDFVLVSQAVPVGLFLGQSFPTASSTFTENSSLLTWTYQTAVLNDNMEMAQSEVAEIQVKTNAVTGLSSITVAAIENAVTINSATFSYAATGALAAQRIDFNTPVVYNRLTLKITGSSYAGFQIGDIFVRARTLGYQTAFPHP